MILSYSHAEPVPPTRKDMHAGTGNNKCTAGLLTRNGFTSKSNLHSSNSFGFLDSELHHHFTMACFTQLILFAVFYNVVIALGPQQIFLGENGQENVEVFSEDLESRSPTSLPTYYLAWNCTPACQITPVQRAVP